jgi:hypothetical protein
MREEEQRQSEVPAGKASVGDGVGRQLSSDEGDGACGVGVVRKIGPLGELLDGEFACEAGAAPRTAEAEGQLGDGGAWFVDGLLLRHVASVGGRRRG